MAIKIIIFCIVLLSGCVILGFLLGWAMATLSDDSPFISFKLVKTGYEINPKRWKWDIAQPSIGFKGEEYNLTWYRLHFFDWIKAYFFFEGIEKRKNQERDRENLVNLLKIVQSDVEKALKESQQEQEDALKEMKKICGNAGLSSDTSCKKDL